MNANLDTIDAAVAAVSSLSGTANKVLATPNGSTGVASLRALVLADLPAGTELTSHKDAASGYAGLDATTKLLCAELPDWLIEGVNNSVVRGPVDGSGNPNYGAVSTVSTTATYKFVCATVNLELWIAGRFQRVADSNVVNVVLTNGSDSTHAAANFIYLKHNASVTQLTSSDIGVTSKAPIFGNNQTQPSVYAGADKQFWFNPMTNKWMSSTGSAAYVNDPIVPIAVSVITNAGVELATAYWGPRMTPWRVMELFGQGDDGALHNQTGTSANKSGAFHFTSLIVSGGNLVHGSVASTFLDGIWFSQAPVVICGTGTIACNGGNAGANANGGGQVGATGNAASTAPAGAAGFIGGAGGGGGGATAHAGGLGGGRFTGGGGAANGGTAGTTAPTAGATGATAISYAKRTTNVITYVTVFIGGAGGAGGGDGTNAGGSGGGSGGGVRMHAPGLVIASGSSWTCNGGNGGNGAGGNAAGGGGGGGGFAGFRGQYMINNGTWSAAGGTGGTGQGTGKDGGSGGVGITEFMKIF